MSEDHGAIPAAATWVVGGVALLAVGILIWTVGASTPSARAESSTVDELSKHARLLSEPRSAEDSLPERFGAESVVRESTQYLGRYDRTDFWAGVGEGGEVCLIAGFDGDLDIAATSCADSSRFDTNGLGLQANTAAGAVVAYLVPDTVKGVRSVNGLDLIHPNLLVGDPFVEGRSVESLKSNFGAIELLPFGEPGDFR
ncbi:hypothetical protein [Microbacterium lacticum]